jgi:hypothetical protein
MIELRWRICGNETLGITLEKESESPGFRGTPITPMIDTQLDQIVIQGILQPLRCQLVCRLNEMMKRHKLQDFLEIFLTVFLLLYNCETHSKAMTEFASVYGEELEQNSNYPLFLRKYFHSANTLIAHFHFLCGGSALFRSQFPSDATIGNCNEEQVQYIREIREEVSSKGLSISIVL